MPDQVVADMPKDRVELDETVRLNAEVDDASYEEINTSQVSAWITDPDDELIEVPLDWTADRDRLSRALRGIRPRGGCAGLR